MRIAHDDQGNKFGEIDGRMVPITVARDADGNRWYHTGDEKWTLVSDSAPSGIDKKADPPQQPKQNSADPFSAYGAATDALSMDSTGLDTSNVDARSMGIAGRGVLNGVAALPQLAGMGVDLATGAMGFDTHLGDVNLGDKAADLLNMPTPENDQERLLASTISGGASMVTPFGVGKVFELLGKAPRVARFLTAAPKTQVASGMAAGAADEVLRQNDFGPGARFAGSMAAGVLPGALVGGVKSALTAGKRTLGDFRSPAGQMDIAAGVLADNGITESSIDAAQRAYQGKFRGLPDPELDPTLPMLLSDNATVTGLGASLEQGGGKGSQITARTNAIRGDSQRGINREMNAAKERVDAIREANTPLEGSYVESIPLGRSAEEVGGPMYDKFKSEYAAQKAKKRDAYSAMDEANAAPYTPAGLIRAIEGSLPDVVTGEVPAAVKKAVSRLSYFNGERGASSIVDAKGKPLPLPSTPENVPWLDWHDIQSEMGDAANEAFRAGRNKEGSKILAAQTAARKAAEKMEGASQHKLVTDAANTRIEQDARFERGTNKKLSRLTGDAQNGASVEDAAVPGMFFKPGAAGASSMISFDKWGKGSPLMEEYARRLIHDAVVSPEGKLTPGKFATFQRDYAPALKHLPGLTGEVSDIGKNLKNLSGLKGAQTELETALADAGTFSKRTGNWNMNAVEADSLGPTGSKLLSKAEADRLNDAMHPLNTIRAAENSARMPGSPTSRNLAGQYVLSQVMPGSEVPLVRPGAIGNVKGTVKNILNNRLVKAMAGATDEANTAVKTYLQEAYANPDYAKYLLEQARLHPKDPILKGVKDGLTGGVKGGILGAIDQNGRDKKQDKKTSK